MNPTSRSTALPIATPSRRASLRPFAVGLGLVAAAVLSAIPVRASDHIGVYALITKVVLEPTEAAPERIQVHGAFSVAVGYGITYTNAQRGYLYFKLNTEKKEQCLREWNDLKAQAGKKEVIGFGIRHSERKPTVRKSSDKPEKADVYEMGIGLQRARQSDYLPVKQLLQLDQGQKSVDSKPKSTAPPPSAHSLRELPGGNP